MEYISLAINGGYNGMEDRKKFYAKAQQVLVAQATAPAPRGLPMRPAKPRKRAVLVTRTATRATTAAPNEALIIYSGTISVINDHLLTVVMAQGQHQTLQTSSLRSLRPGVLIAWCEEDCNRLRIGERWTRVRSIALVRP